ncbi:MAG: glycoside hydrolase family 18 protein [Clostridia bacterium]|nr:glycoside hydrolase family 18 protein [Clostridia bacterium]
MSPRKGGQENRRGAKALCLILVFCLTLPLFACAAPAQDPEDYAFGEEFQGFPEGHPPVGIYLQVSGAGAYMEGRETMLPPDAPALVDIIYLAFARFDGEEILFPDVPAELREYQKAGVSLILSFSANAGDSSARLREIARDPDRTRDFAEKLAEGAKAAGLDGIDLDWEAIPGGASPDPAGMNALTAALRQAGGEDFLLSCAVPCSPWGLGTDRYDFPALAETVDYFNLMSYDLGKENRATHLAPLWSSKEDGGWELGAAAGAGTLLKAGVKPSQILLGCAAYGRAYRCEEDAVPGAAGHPVKLDLPGAYDSGVVQGKGLEALLADPAWTEKSERNDRGFVASYLTNGKLFVSYDSTASYREKYDFACRAGCGLMLWSLTQDTGDRFLSVLREKNNA